MEWNESELYQTARDTANSVLAGSSPTEQPSENVRKIARPNGLTIVENSTSEQPEQVAVEFDVPEDSYGAAILGIVKDGPRRLWFTYPGWASEESEFDEWSMSFFRSVYALALLCLNLMSQGLMLFFIYKHVVKPAVLSVQVLFRDFHGTVFDDQGNFLPDAWDEWAYKDNLCEIAMTNIVFYDLILFLWTLSMMQEFRAGERFYRDISSLPTVYDFRDMIQEHQTEDGQFCHRIVGVTRFTRWSLYILVVFPKVSFSILLFYCGAGVLSATMSFQDLVLNAVAMTFVTEIDELLYDALMPAPYKKDVERTKFMVLEKFDPKKEKRSERKSFKRSAIYFIVGLGVVYTYGTLLQDVLPRPLLREINVHCEPYLESLKNICSMRQIISGDYVGCFSYGGGSTRLAPKKKRRR